MGCAPISPVASSSVRCTPSSHTSVTVGDAIFAWISTVYH